MTQPETVQTLLAELGDATPEEVLADAARRYAGRVAFASSLGAEDQVLTHIIRDGGPRHPDLHARHRTPVPGDLRLAGPHGRAPRPVHQDVLPGRRGGREDGRQGRRQPLPRQHRGAAPLLRGAQDPAAAPRASASWAPGSVACAAARAPRGRTWSSPSGTSWPTWSRSTRWPPGTRRACGTTSAPTTCPTTRCTTRASRASAARRAREPSPTARTGAPAAGGGELPEHGECGLHDRAASIPGSAADATASG